MAAHPELLLAAQGILWVVIKLPRKYMDVVDRRFGLVEEATAVMKMTSGCLIDLSATSPTCWSTREVCVRVASVMVQGGQSTQRRAQWARGEGLCSVRKKADYHPVAFFARLPGGCRLSQLLDPRNVTRSDGSTRRWWME